MQVAEVHIAEEKQKHQALLQKIKEVEESLNTKSSPPPPEPEPKENSEMVNLLKQTLAKVGELEAKVNKKETEPDDGMKRKGSLHGKNVPPPASETSAPSADDDEDETDEDGDEDAITTPNGVKVTLMHTRVQ